MELAMSRIVFSTKGQVVIPKDLRDAKGFGPGVAAEAIDHPEGVLIKAIPVRKKRDVRELNGILAPYYNGPPVTIEEMNEAIAEAAIERYARSFK
jgi:bifunctional DNA-binding transcriptional regulator/antitoxin component of YhaV-PrlF toxin-antitoxin module